ncbi:MAG: hypothetical protein J0I47_13035 [Sphingomonas sp.]|uniref:hypothetical protein n=1 Tax=Sphingomonas sp. TaxID=28214 RepID=UPI001AC23F6C|nr:hypothetical protein [Sphingomonas sp.]MBN8809142.1 hypothetical protein [Sphingomonas sp.]
MNTDIDTALRRLSATDHPGLGGIEGAVMTGVRAGRETRTGMRMAAIAGIGAIALGTVAAGPGAQPASAAPLAPFGVAAPLAPSTLLTADR